MKRSSLILAALLPLFASVALPAAADQKLTIATVKQIEVRSAAELKRAFGFASTNGRQAIEISCHPASSSWCANEFVAACDKNDGGMSSDPDGGVTCSLPQHE